MNHEPISPRGRRRGPCTGWLLLLLTLCGGLAAAPARARLLIPMDLKQADHLKAYGLAYWVLTTGDRVEWLLNYRGGCFLLNETTSIVKEANIRGVTFLASLSNALTARFSLESSSSAIDCTRIHWSCLSALTVSLRK